MYQILIDNNIKRELELLKKKKSKNSLISNFSKRKRCIKKDIKVMDCTVRDGGLMNKWQFSDEFVKGVYNSCVEAGIDYMENRLQKQRKSIFP